MSHLSHVATSGSSPIAACSAAWAAPGTFAASMPLAASWAGLSVHQTARVWSRRGGSPSASSPRISPLPTRRLEKATICDTTSTDPNDKVASPQVWVTSVASTPMSVTSRAVVV